MIARVRSGGPGGHIDVPMFGTTLGIAALQTSEYFGTGRDPRKLGSAHPRNAPYQAFKARDGWFVIAAGNNRALGRPSATSSARRSCSTTSASSRRRCGRPTSWR